MICSALKKKIFDCDCVIDKHFKKMPLLSLTVLKILCNIEALQ